MSAPLRELTREEILAECADCGRTLRPPATERELAAKGQTYALCAGCESDVEAWRNR